MELQAITGQLHVIDGVVQAGQTAPGILAQSAPQNAARERRKDFLFVHFSLTGSGEETAVYTQTLIHLLSSSFYSNSGSVTSALRKAIIATNDHLLRHNINSSDTHEGAISCAVMRNNELFTLQVGESITYLGHDFGIELLPPKPPSRIMPMGRSAGLDFRFFHHSLEEGNMLLFMDPRLTHLPVQSFKPVLVDSEVETGLDSLRHLVGDDSGRLLLVEFTANAPTDLPLATVADEAPPSPPPTSSEKLANDSRRAASKTAMGLSVFTGWLADFLASVRPPNDGEDAPVTDWAVPAAIAVIIPIIIAVIVMGVYVKQGQGQRFADIKVEIGQHIAYADSAGDDTDLAREHYAAALELAAEGETLRPEDTGLGRLRIQVLTELDSLDSVVRLTAQPFYEYEEGTGLTAVALRDGFEGGIYTIDAANDAAYYHHTDQTYLNAADPLKDTPDQILFAGQAIGSEIIVNLVDGLWDGDNYAMLDSTGLLLAQYPDEGNVTVAPLGLASDWQQPTDIDMFNGRLYILDTGAGEIWKYFADSNGGYVADSDERVITFDASSLDPDLTHMIDFDIYSEDGSLIAVYGDGRVRYYDTRSGRVSWDEADLLNNGLQSPLVAPIAGKMIGRGLNSSIFIADPGSGRIVQISRAGTVLAQYRAATSDGTELFNNLTDFAIAENPLRIFVTTPTTLYTAILE